MNHHLREWCRECCCFEVVINKSVDRLCPFQNDVRAVVCVIGDELTVEGKAFLLQHSHGDFDAGITQLLDAASLHLGKRVDAANHHSSDAFADNQVGAWRSAAVMAAW